jgi:hypothetical protein
MRLRYGIPLLLALWIGSGQLADPRWELVLRVLAMGVALWTAFSLPIPPRRPAPAEELQIVTDEDDGVDAVQAPDETKKPDAPDGDRA